MRALARKRWRDLWILRGPVVAIVMVFACGVGLYVASVAMVDALQATQEAFYRQGRFADVFGSVVRAPENLRTRLQAIPGVTLVETRVKARAPLDVPGFAEPVSALLISLPDEGLPLLNDLHLTAGRFPLREGEVVVGDAFAEAQGLTAGDTLGALLNGRRERLTLVGLARTPEFVYQMPPGELFPDHRRFALVWIRRTALAAAYNLRGAFNDVALSLQPTADEAEVVAAVDRSLERYGGPGATGRNRQASHYYLTEEFRQLKQAALTLPILFLGVAAFLIAVVVARLVQTQREQIATLKAFGYRTGDVARHYGGLVLTIAMLGTALGIALGVWLGRGMAGLYAEFYRFPTLLFRLRPVNVLVATGLTAAIALAAALHAVLRAARLPPAVAMQPPIPSRYGPALAERAGVRLSGLDRMMLRHLERHPGRALLTTFGIAMACALVLLGRFSGDAIGLVLDVQFEQIHREDLDVAFTRPTRREAAREVDRLPGVRTVEAYRTAPVALRRGLRSYDTAIIGMDGRSDLVRVLDDRLQAVTLPTQGLVLSHFLADYLGVTAGDTLTVVLREGKRRPIPVPVSQTTHEFVGAGAYMNRPALNRLLDEGDVVTGVWVEAETSARPLLMRALRERPGVLRATTLPEVRTAMEATMAENLLIFTLLLTAFAVATAFGVLYNANRLSLEERARELASLRVLGFTRAETGYLFFGELALLTLGALPVGLLLGRSMSFAYVARLQTELFRFPYFIGRASYAFAATVVLGTALLSALIVRYRLWRLDLVTALKTRE